MTFLPAASQIRHNFKDVDGGCSDALTGQSDVDKAVGYIYPCYKVLQIAAKVGVTTKNRPWLTRGRSSQWPEAQSMCSHECHLNNGVLDSARGI